LARCVVDGAPINEKRLLPWTPYCLKRQQLFESSTP
jgi:RNA polymerase-binding transcription factor DksA